MLTQIDPDNTKTNGQFKITLADDTAPKKFTLEVIADSTKTTHIATANVYITPIPELTFTAATATVNVNNPALFTVTEGNPALFTVTASENPRRPLNLLITPSNVTDTYHY